eukprot:354731-Chlamydomonas_euryale.AAC.10
MKTGSSGRACPDSKDAYSTTCHSPPSSQADVNPETSEVNDFWGYQYCTEMFQIFSKDGQSDMFWEDAWDPEATAAACKEQWHVTPRPMWATQVRQQRRVSKGCLRAPRPVRQAAFLQRQRSDGASDGPSRLQEWGGKDIRMRSNIVFSNGLLDPWHGGGVLLDVSIEHTVVSLIIPEGAHHLDLMFSHDDDPVSGAR